MPARGCRGSHLDIGDLLGNLGDNAGNGQGTAGQVGLVLQEVGDLAMQQNMSPEAMWAARVDGLRSRLFLKYISVDYEFFNSPDHQYR